jgi:hypothetical protein
LASSLVGLYFGIGGFTLWFSTILIVAMLFLRTESTRMRAVDWSVLLLGAFELPSLLFSQYLANGIRTSVSIVILALTYCVIRLAIRTNLEVAVFSGILGLGGGWLPFSGLRQFYENATRLRSLGLMNLVAFRSRLISPPIPWISGEWFTLLFLILPFACVPPLYFPLKQMKLPAAIAFVLSALIVAMLCLSLSRAIFWSVVVFCVMFCAFLLLSRITPARRVAALFGAALVAVVLIVSAEAAFFPGLLKVYSGQHTSQILPTFCCFSKAATLLSFLPLQRAWHFWSTGPSVISVYRDRGCPDGTSGWVRCLASSRSRF